MIDASVVIPTLDNGHVIGQQLAALARQAFSGDWEVVVVDNGSSDDTNGTVRAFAGRIPDLRLLSNPVPGNSYAGRNHGAAEARGRDLLFCDGDDVVQPGWVEGLVDGLASHGCVAGRLDLDLLNPHPYRAWRPDPEPQRPTERRLGFLPGALTANLGVRAGVFTEVGGFDSRFATAGDLDFCWRAHRVGHPVHRVDGAVVAYRYRRTYRAHVRQAYQYGSGIVPVYAAWRYRGMPRSSTWGALKGWALVATDLPSTALSRSRRGRVAWSAAMSAGRLVGSARARVWFP